MDILKNISSLFGEKGESTFNAIYDVIEKYGFDLKKILQNVDISSLMPVLTSFFSPAESEKKEEIKKEKREENSSPLYPILSFADGTILSALSKYLDT